MKFKCDRTCSFAQVCKFDQILAALGRRGKVNSNTIKVRVAFGNHTALTSAVEALGGKVLGEGSHRLFGGLETGFGFTLPSWKYPLVAKPNGELSFDDYNGVWGNKADIDELKRCYKVEAARAKAGELGWYAEANADGSLSIMHPTGGMLRVTGDGIEASGFIGSGCAEASAPIAEAMGVKVDEVRKPEYYQAQVEVKETE